jgi:hypothetical protein
LQSRRQAPLTHVKPPLQGRAREQASNKDPVPSGMHAVAPVKSAIWQVVPRSIAAQDAGSIALHVFTGKQSNAPVSTGGPLASWTSNLRRQCSPSGHPVQSAPQQIFLQKPPAQMDPRAQSVHAVQAVPTALVPAASH